MDKSLQTPTTSTSGEANATHRREQDFSQELASGQHSNFELW